MAKLTNTYVPVDTRSSDLLSLNNADTGTLVMSLRPGNKRPAYVYQDLLTALGKDHDYGARTKSLNEDRTNLVAYLRAHPIKHIVAIHGEWVRRADGSLQLLLDLASACGARLTIVSELDRNETARDFVRSRGGRQAAWRPRDWIPKAEAPPTGKDSNFPTDVPQTDFPLFLATAKRLLPEGDFKRVQDAYWIGYETTRGRLAADATSTDAVNLFHDLLRSARSPAEATTLIRGAQSAALSGGYLLKVDLRQLAALVHDAAQRSLTHEEMLLLRRLHEPWRAAAVVLTDAGMSVNDIRAVTLTDVDANGRVSSQNLARPLVPEARLHLRALRLERTSLGALTPSEDARIFRKGDRAINGALHQAQRDLQLPLDLPRWRMGRSADRWQSALGVSLKRVTG